MELLEHHGAKVLFHDPFVAEIAASREHASFVGRRSVELSEALLSSLDATVIATDNDAVDYRTVVRLSPIVIDARNVLARLGLSGRHVIKA